MNKITNDKKNKIKKNGKTKDKNKITKKNKEKKEKNKQLTYKDFTITEIEQELKRINYESKYKKLLKSTIFTLVVVVAISTIIASFILSILEINGSSMEPTLKEGQFVIAYKDNNIEKNDVIAFYQGNKILIKRVIATQGSYVEITDDGDVYVNGKLLKEIYVDKKSLGNSNIEYPHQVPDGHYFVLGDKRDTSIDSRNSIVGTISKEDVLGKVVISIWPLNKMGIVK